MTVLKNSFLFLVFMLITFLINNEYVVHAESLNGGCDVIQVHSFEMIDVTSNGVDAEGFETFDIAANAVFDHCSERFGANDPDKYYHFLPVLYVDGQAVGGGYFGNSSFFYLTDDNFEILEWPNTLSVWKFNRTFNTSLRLPSGEHEVLFAMEKYIYDSNVVLDFENDRGDITASDSMTLTVGSGSNTSDNNIQSGEYGIVDVQTGVVDGIYPYIKYVVLDRMLPEVYNWEVAGTYGAEGPIMGAVYRSTTPSQLYYVDEHGTETSEIIDTEVENVGGTDIELYIIKTTYEFIDYDVDIREGSHSYDIRASDSSDVISALNWDVFEKSNVVIEAGEATTPIIPGTNNNHLGGSGSIIGTGLLSFLTVMGVVGLSVGMSVGASTGYNQPNNQLPPNSNLNQDNKGSKSEENKPKELKIVSDFYKVEGRDSYGSPIVGLVIAKVVDQDNKNIPTDFYIDFNTNLHSAKHLRVEEAGTQPDGYKAYDIIYEEFEIKEDFPMKIDVAIQAEMKTTLTHNYHSILIDKPNPDKLVIQNKDKSHAICSFDSKIDFQCWVSTYSKEQFTLEYDIEYNGKSFINNIEVKEAKPNSYNISIDNFMDIEDIQSKANIKIKLLNDQKEIVSEELISVDFIKRGLILVNEGPIKLKADGEEIVEIGLTAVKTTENNKLITDQELLKSVVFHDEVDVIDDNPKARIKALNALDTSHFYVKDINQYNVINYSGHQILKYTFAISTQRGIPADGAKLNIMMRAKTSGKEFLDIPIEVELDHFVIGSKDWQDEYEKCLKMMKYVPLASKQRFEDALERKKYRLGAEGLFEFRKQLWSNAQRLWEEEGVKAFETVELWEDYIKFNKILTDILFDVLTGGTYLGTVLKNIRDTVMKVVECLCDGYDWDYIWDNVLFDKLLGDLSGVIDAIAMGDMLEAEEFEKMIKKKMNNSSITTKALLLLIQFTYSFCQQVFHPDNAEKSFLTIAKDIISKMGSDNLNGDLLGFIYEKVEKHVQ